VADYSQTVAVLLKLEQVRQFVTGATDASKAIEGVGTATEKTGKKASLNWKSIAKWGGAATAVYGAQKFIRGAVSETETLGASTLALNRSTGLGIQTSSKWAAVLQSRGQNVKQFQMGLVKLSREMEKSRQGYINQQKQMHQLRAAYAATAAAGGKDAPKQLEKLRGQMNRVMTAGEKSRALWTQLGVSFDAVRKGNIEVVMNQVADALHRMKNPAEKAAIAQQLFARQGQALAPIFYKGAAAIKENLDTAGRYVKFGPKNAKQVKQLIADEREMRLAYMGMQVSLGTALLPVMNQVSQVIIQITRAIAPLTHNATALKVVIIALTAAFIAYKIAMIASAIATGVFETAALPIVGIVLAIVAGLALLAIGIYLVIKHWGWLKAKAVDVWTWIKHNWPLLLGILLGPFATATVLVIKHWDAIKKGVKAMVDFVIAQFQRAIDFIKSIPSKIGHPFKSALHGVTGVAGKGFGKVKGLFGGQYGGTITSAGALMVGERGPEVVHLPGGANITPLTGAPSPLPAGGGFGEARITTEVILDRRVLAQAVGHYTADKLARR
jgi:hypothetical protein